MNPHINVPSFAPDEQVEIDIHIGGEDDRRLASTGHPPSLVERTESRKPGGQSPVLLLSAVCCCLLSVVCLLLLSAACCLLLLAAVSVAVGCCLLLLAMMLCCYRCRRRCRCFAAADSGASHAMPYCLDRWGFLLLIWLGLFYFFYFFYFSLLKGKIAAANKAPR